MEGSAAEQSLSDWREAAAGERALPGSKEMISDRRAHHPCSPPLNAEKYHAVSDHRSSDGHLPDLITGVMRVRSAVRHVFYTPGIEKINGME